MSNAYPESQETPAAEEEVEVWWGAFAGRTAVPGFVLCALVTAVVCVGLYAWGVLQPARWWAFLLTSPLWLVQIGRWLYRTTAYNYRLTNRRLFVSRSFSAAARVVDLARVERVVVERSRLRRRLGVGRIRIEAKEIAPLILDGVRDPAAVATLIGNRVQQAREVGAKIVNPNGTE
jgi:hypothetical protein